MDANETEGRRKSTQVVSRRDVFRGTSLLRSYLEIELPGEERSVVELDEKPLVMGRGDDCNLRLSSPSVSWNHARVFRSGEEFIIEDLNSTNGTKLNNVSIARSFLRHMDCIEIGDIRLFYLEKLERNQE